MGRWETGSTRTTAIDLRPSRERRGHDRCGSALWSHRVTGGVMNYCATLGSGGLDCWGQGNDGQLGNGILYNEGPAGDGTPSQVLGGVNGPYLTAVQQVSTAIESVTARSARSSGLPIRSPAGATATTENSVTAMSTPGQCNSGRRGALVAGSPERGPARPARFFEINGSESREMADMARIVPANPRTSRTPGYWSGRVRLGPNFDDLPEVVAAAFCGDEQ